MNKDCPCRYCVPPKRTVTCHTTCQEYKDWCETHDARKREIFERRNELDVILSYTAKQRIKNASLNKERKSKGW